MAESDAGNSPDRTWARTGLVLCALVVVIAAATLMPAFGTDGVEGSPLEQIIPGESAGETSAESRFGNESGLGALNPGESTGVGGDVGLDSETYGNTETAVHFTVQSTAPSYWRTGAYDRYTGSGWVRTGDSQPLEGSIEHDGIDGERIEWEIEFEQSATAVPTAWRPKVIEGLDDPRVTTEGALRASSPIDVGETIEGVSYSPQRDEGALRAADQRYPTEITDRYLQLQSDRSEQIEQFTSELTADEETTYEQAVRIENWLEESKAYDLGVAERSENIAATFIFEMEAGYCEYFATAMVSMLRSQDIPARYVVGYSTGQPVGDNTYEVRAMNAHAWVEVYFEDIGWVRFDPTPATPRLETQEQALEADGEELDINEIIPDDGTEQDDPPTEDGFQTELNQTALPGEPVEVTVTDNGVAVTDEVVYFNGNPVGTTDQDGRVVGTVPDADELEITVRAGRTETASAGSNTVRAGQLAGGMSGPAIQQAGERSDTHPIERTATIAVSGETTPGETVTVTVAAGDTLLDGATVTVDGVAVGETNAEGQLDIELPAQPGNVTLGAKRGLVSGERQLEVSELTVTVDSGRLPAMALGTVTVEARLGDEPAAGVPVEIGGKVVATTGSDGTATVRVPLQSEATIAVRDAGQRAEIVLTGLLLRSVLGTLLSVGLLGIPVIGLRKLGYGLRDLARVLRVAPRTVVAGCQRTLVVVVLSGDDYLLRAATRVRSVGGTLGATLRGQRSVTDLRTLVSVWVSDSRSWWSQRLRPTPEDPNGDTDQPTVQDAWSEFLDQVSVSTVETQTPGELAAHAVDQDGLPEEPVLELRDIFREVEYGSRPPTDKLDRVQEAIEEIARAEGDD